VPLIPVYHGVDATIRPLTGASLASSKLMALPNNLLSDILFVAIGLHHGGNTLVAVTFT